MTEQAGFTLLEVLIALTLMSVLSLLSWRALDSTARTSEHLEAESDETIALLRVLGQIESDLAAHAASDVLPAFPTDEKKPVPLASLLPSGIRWNTPRLTIIRSTESGGWQEVVWTLEGNRLLRATGLPSVSLPLPEAAYAQTMLAGVSNFSLRAWLPGLGWTQSATTSPERARGLEIALGVAATGETFRKVVVLP